MAYYSWEYLRNMLSVPWAENVEITQTLLNAHGKGEKLTLPEKIHVYSTLKILLKHDPDEHPIEYAFNPRDLKDFKEAMFSDVFRTHLKYNNLTGEREIELPLRIRKFPLAEDMRILDDALHHWKLLNDQNPHDPYLARIRKDCKDKLKEIEKQRKSFLIGSRRANYNNRLVKFLSYDIYIFVESLFEEEGAAVVTVSKSFDKPVLLTKAAAAHIIFTHYFPDLDEFRRAKSRFDERNQPYELAYDLKNLFKNAFTIAENNEKSQLRKIDFEFNGRIIRCRLKAVNSGQQQVYHISTLHPLEIPAAHKQFEAEAKPLDGGGDFTRIKIYNRT